MIYFHIGAIFLAFVLVKSYMVPNGYSLRSSRSSVSPGTRLLVNLPEVPWSQTAPNDLFSQNVDDELIAIDVESLLAGAGEQGDMQQEEYSDSLKEMLKIAELNFKKLTTGETEAKIQMESALQNGLRNYREKAQQGIAHMISGDLNKALECFDAAQEHNKTQVLLQRGITLYILGKYGEAAHQFELDVRAMENRNLKFFKATDARIWWSAALRRQNKVKEAIDALDICNKELEESRYYMQCMLSYYAGETPLKTLLETVGDVDAKGGVAGITFYGNFYIGLYLHSAQDYDMARVFLDLSCAGGADSERLSDADLWKTLPTLLRASII